MAVKRVAIGLDVMGGDNAPYATVRAGLAVAQRLGDVRVVLIGDRVAIEEVLARESLPANFIEIIDAPEHAPMEDEAIAAVRRKGRAPIPVGLELLKQGETDVFLSAGNTGAVVASAVIGLGRLPGVARPGIAIPFPSTAGLPMHLIDAGAIVDPKPEVVWQHARLANVFARSVNGIDRPAIGLVSNGEEPGKGNALAREVYSLLENDSDLHFIGNVETRAIATRPCDVLVTDGFTGNVVLKTAEGAVSLMQETLRAEFRSRWYTTALAGFLKPAFRRAGKSLDYREYGGAPLLGVNGLVFIAHGSSDETALVNAIQGAVLAAQHDALERLTMAMNA